MTPASSDKDAEAKKKLDDKKRYQEVKSKIWNRGYQGETVDATAHVVSLHRCAKDVATIPDLSKKYETRFLNFGLSSSNVLNLTDSSLLMQGTK